MLRPLLLACSLLVTLPASTAFAQPAEKKERREPTEAEVKEAEEKSKKAAGVLGMSLGVFVLACIATVFLEMIPAVIAFARGHPNAVPIALVCFFFGWTCIGWIIAFIWAFTAFDVIEEPRRRRRSRRDDYDD